MSQPSQPAAALDPLLAFVITIGTGLLAWLFMTASAFLVVFGALVGGVPHKELLARPELLLVGAAAGQLALGLVIPVSLRVFRAILPPLSGLPLRAPSPSALAGALVLVLGLAPLAQGAAGMVQTWTGAESASTFVVLTAARAPTPTFIGFLVVVAVMPAVFEEALFRGVVMQLFLPRQALALVVSSLAFAVVHGELVQGVGTFVLGLGFGAARLASRSLWPAVLAHGMFNGSVLLLARYGELPDDPSAEVVPEPVALLAGLGFAAVGAAMLWQVARRHNGSIQRA